MRSPALLYHRSAAGVMPGQRGSRRAGATRFFALLTTAVGPRRADGTHVVITAFRYLPWSDPDFQPPPSAL